MAGLEDKGWSLDVGTWLAGNEPRDLGAPAAIAHVLLCAAAGAGATPAAVLAPIVLRRQS